MSEGERFLKSGFAYLYINDFDKALDSFRRAIDCEPANAHYYFHASFTALRSQRRVWALHWAVTAQSLAPEDALFAEHVNVARASILERTGQVLAQSGHVELAAALLGQAAQLDPLHQHADPFQTVRQGPGNANDTGSHPVSNNTS